MRALKSLLETEPHVWLCCATEELQIQFLEQAEAEGFICMNGQKPTELFHSPYYGIDQDMTMGYVSTMCWVLSSKYPGHVIIVGRDEHMDPIRIDYGKYIAGETDYII